MIINEFYNGQGLGNQLWNYVLLRIIAKNNACGFYAMARERFKGIEFMDIDFGTEYTGEIKHYYREKTEFLLGTDIDISRTDPELLKLIPYTKFDGNCQSTKYLEGHRQDILMWIKIKDEFKKYTTDNNVCVIHFRSGDFKKIKEVFLPYEYYQHAMDYVRKINKNITFYCVTDEKEEAERMLPGVEIIGAALLEKNDSKKASHHQGGPIGVDFSYLLNASYLIIPNSSFSWWAAYLNTRKNVVIAPKYWARHNISNGYWSNSDIITDSFTYLDTKGTAFTSEECWKEKKVFEASLGNIFSLIPQPKRNLIYFIKKLLDFNKNKRNSKGILEYRKTVKIYDIFTFFNELEILEIRLNILDNFVDYFVIIESTETFSGKPKNLFYENNKARFDKWKHKIIYHVIDDVPINPDDLKKRLLHENISDLDNEIINNTLTSDNVPVGEIHWFKEFYQKESIKKALVGLNDNDLCFVSDVDEIWNPEIKFTIKDTGIFRLRQNMYAYFLNNRSSEKWVGTLLTRYINVKNSCLNHLRTPRKTKYTYIKNGGWHFTNMGGADRIRDKIESYGHQEFNNDKIKTDLESKIMNNTDFIGRDFHFWVDDTMLPTYIINNKDEYKNFFK